jgi:hypothetical protein
MPGRYSAKEERQIEHIEQSEEKRGKSADEAKRIAYATVTKQGEEHGVKRYTPQEKRQAKHIAQSEEERGKTAQEAKSIGYATVNKRNR